jgi:amino acid transporter
MNTNTNESPALTRHFGTLQATALNMSNMIGIGPFLTIPLLMSALGGPQAMLGWLVALVLVICDGMVWSELGAMMPGAGGSYVYLREAFGSKTLGRLMAFLFIWQFIVSGPMEIASGYIGFAQYLGYIWPAAPVKVVVVMVGLLNIALLYRRIHHIGKLTVSLWIGTLLTVGAVILTGAVNFDAARAFDFPAGAFNFSMGFLWGLGAASSIGVYDYLGYYDICYLGEEVREPGRTIPRSVMLSVIAVALIYIAINFSIIGIVPWREFVPATDTNPVAKYVVSVMMERAYGRPLAVAVTLMILWTAFGSCFALLLGYSRIPFAAARDGYFFRAFSRLHPQGNFPHVSLLVIGLLAIGCSFFSLGVVINALIVLRILVQFIGQVAALVLLRVQAPAQARPYRMWLYPLPALLALVGWLFIFATSERRVIGFSFAALLIGVVAFGLWSYWQKSWPFHQCKASNLT